MPQLASDNFQRPDENPLSDGGNWSTIFGEVAMQVSSDLCEGGATSANCGSIWTGLTWPNDQYSEITIAGVGGSANIAPAVRGSVTSRTYYFAAVIGLGATLIVLEKLVAGASTLLSFVAATVSVGDVIRLEVQGTSLTVKQNGVVVLGPITDSDIASGSPGLRSTTSAQFATASLWAGGSFAPPPPPPPPPPPLRGFHSFYTRRGVGIGMTGIVLPQVEQPGDVWFDASTGNLFIAVTDTNEFLPGVSDAQNVTNVHRLNLTRSRGLFASMPASLPVGTIFLATDTLAAYAGTGVGVQKFNLDVTRALRGIDGSETPVVPGLTNVFYVPVSG